MKKRNIILLAAAALLFPLQANAFTFKRAEDQSDKTLVNTVLSKGVTSKMQ